MSKDTDKTDIHLHCGAPKTGTTSLSFFFHANESFLNAQNIFFPHRFAMRGDIDPLHEALVACRRPSTESQGIAKARERLSQLRAEKPGCRFLISNESMLGEPFEPGNPEFYPHAEHVAPILREVFDGYRVNISFLIRDFTTFLPSYYVQLVRRGSFQSLTDFVHSIDKETLTWQKPVQALQKTFDDNQINIFNYADFGAAPDTFVQSVFSKSIGVNLPEFASGDFQRNRSFGGLSLQLTRYLNLMTSKFEKDRRNRYRQALRRNFTAPMSRLVRGRRPALPEDLSKTLEKIFERDHKILLGNKNKRD